MNFSEEQKKDWVKQTFQLPTAIAKKILESFRLCRLPGFGGNHKVKKIDVFSWLLTVLAVLLAGINLGIGILFYQEREYYYNIPIYLILSGACFTVISVLFSMVNCRNGLCFSGLWVFFGFVHCTFLILEVILVYILWFQDDTLAADEGHIAPSEIKTSFVMTSAFILVNVEILYTVCTLLCLCVYNRMDHDSRPSSSEAEATELIMFKHTAVPSKVIIQKGCKAPLMSNV